jgi:hypothetical protein
VPARLKLSRKLPGGQVITPRVSRSHEGADHDLSSSSDHVASLTASLCQTGKGRPERIAQFPDIVPPQVTLTATYPGKDPEVIKTTVAQPIEQGV